MSAEEIIKNLQEQLLHEQQENNKNKAFRTKYVEVINKLSKLQPSNAELNIETGNTSTDENTENVLIEKGDSILDNVVSSFKEYPTDKKAEVHQLSNEGSQFIRRIQELEQNCAIAAYNAKLALNKVEDMAQYLKIDHLCVHGLRDIPLKKTGLDFSKYVSEKLEEILPLSDLNLTAEKILNCISVSHPIKSRKNPNNLIVLIKFSNRDIRNKIFYAKRALKGTNISITEHLTPATLELLSFAKNEFGRDCVWTNQTKVIVKIRDNKYTLRNIDDVDRLKSHICNVQHGSGHPATSGHAPQNGLAVSTTMSTASNNFHPSDPNGQYEKQFPIMHYTQQVPAGVNALQAQQQSPLFYGHM